MSVWSVVISGGIIVTATYYPFFSQAVSIRFSISRSIRAMLSKSSFMPFYPYPSFTPSL